MSRERSPGQEVPLGRQLWTPYQYGEFVKPEYFDLPIAEHKQQITDAIRENQVVIVVGETGSGKSTQLPKIGLEMGHISEHTQPRRIAAREVVERVGYEIRQVMPELPPDIVGYQTAEKSTITPNTRISMYTDGLQLVYQLHRPRDRQDVLAIVDEVHEWNANMSILLALYKRELSRNPHLKLVITSATMDAERLQQYFSEVTETMPPIIEVPGRTYPITYIEEPNSTVLEQTIKYASEGKGVLVFQQGQREIRDLIDELRRLLPKDILTQAGIYPLYSRLSEREQHAACESTPPIKIVVATNIAQTSLTISGINCVISDGQARMVEIDKRGHEGLFSRPVSQSALKQQGGRGGRLSEGIHVLTKPNAESEFRSMAQRHEYETPEILRSDVSRHILRLAAMGERFAELDIPPEPVPPELIVLGEASLRTLGALDDNNQVTELGMRMDRYPVRPQLGRMLVKAEQMNTDIRTMVAAIAAVIETGGLPLYDKFASRKWREITEESSSDVLMQLELFTKTREKTDYQLKQLGIDSKNFRRAEELFERLCRLLGVDGKELIVATDEHTPELRSCIYAGYIEHVYRRIGRIGYRLLTDEGDETVFELSNRSVVDRRQAPFVVGSPYRMERRRRGELETIDIIESVTALPDLHMLGDAAIAMTQWTEGGIVWRNGRPLRQEIEHIVGEDTHQLRETAITPSPEVRREVIAYAMKHPGPAQRRLRDLKKELEQLNHRSATPIKVMTQRELEAMIDQATPPDVTDPQQIDDNLWVIMQEAGLDTRYVSKPETEKIIEDAWPFVAINGKSYQVDFRNHKPIIHGIRREVIETLPDHVFTRDGREVLFVFDRREYTAIELKEYTAAHPPKSKRRR